MGTNDTIAIVFAFVFMVSIVSIIGGLMYARRERILTHAERMKALEMGVPVPDLAAAAHIKAALGQSAGANDGDKRSPAVKCFSTAVSGLGGADVSAGVAYAIASATGAIGMTAVICGTILASRPAPTTHYSNGYAKPTNHDVDAFDVVSCRG
jgi:hypothetical protein